MHFFTATIQYVVLQLHIIHIFMYWRQKGDQPKILEINKQVDVGAPGSPSIPNVTSRCTGRTKLIWMTKDKKPASGAPYGPH